MRPFLRGLQAGVPIGLGYLSVSFSFGIMAVSSGFSWWQALLVSMTTLTSAGQLAGIGIMTMPGQYNTMLISQLTINIRYSFMSLSLAQKVSPSFKGLKRWLLGFFMTDEIFAVASSQQQVQPSFFAGLTVAPYIGWTLGTLCGGLLGNVLPQSVMDALCLAMYGMFVAIIVPQAKKSKAVALVAAGAALLHTAFYYVPLLTSIPSGLSISLCAIGAAVAGAVFFPIETEQEDAA